MANTEMDGVSKMEPQPLQIDPKCFEGALRGFFQPIKNDGPRLNFYNVYKREAAKYDMDYVKNYNDDLNATLIFAGLFSAVSSAFAIDVYSKLQLHPNDQSVAILRDTLLALKESAVSNATIASSCVQKHPSTAGVSAAAVLLFASLLISLLAALVAVLGKQWLNRYLLHEGGSIIERCGDRQRKCDGLRKWRFHLIVESLPVMLQISLLLLACGLCQYMALVNAPLAGALSVLTLLGVLFYVGIVIASASSYDCPFQTPASDPLRSLWTRIGPHLPPLIPFTIAYLRPLGGAIRSQVHAIQSSLVSLHRHSGRLLERANLVFGPGRRPRRRGLMVYPSPDHESRSEVQGTPRSPILPNPPRSQGIAPWFTPNELAVIHLTNAIDIQCVSWVLRNITDQDVLDAAIRFAGGIRWFEDCTNMEPPYDLIVSTFRACFGSNGEVYPGSRDRAYYSGRAILWIHTLAVCRSGEFALAFPLPTVQYAAPVSDHDLSHLLGVSVDIPEGLRFTNLLCPGKGATLSPSHLRWISNILLHMSWATPVHSLELSQLHQRGYFLVNGGVPLDAMLNRLLVCCNLLGMPVEGEVLKIQDKSDRLEPILAQVSRAIVSALGTPCPRHELIWDVLNGLTTLKSRPPSLTEMAYGWCAVIWKNRRSCGNWERLLLLSLEVGFRHLDPRESQIFIDLTHTEHHQGLVHTVFGSGESEAAADLLCALTLGNSPDRNDQLAFTLLGMCPRYIVDLRDGVTAHSSSRLRQLLIRTVELVGHMEFEEVGMERFVELLNKLRVRTADINDLHKWIPIVLEIIQSPEGVRQLATWSWKLLVETSASCGLKFADAVYAPHVTTSLLEERKWEKLECWLGVVWMEWPPETENVTEELKNAMASLFRHRPGAVRTLAQWMERWGGDAAETFQRICKEANEVAQLDLW